MAQRTRNNLIAEGILIVVSILLAFGIDAAWDARGDRAQEAVALAGLRDDFIANRTQMDRILERHRARAEAFAWFETARPQDIAAISADSASAIFRSLYLPESFDGVRGNADALIGAGRMELLRSEPLRERLATFINLVDDADEEKAAMRTGSIDVFRATTRYGGPWGVGASSLSRIDSADLAALRRDEEFMGLVRLAYHWSYVYAIQLAGISEVIDDILVLLGRADGAESG